MDVDFSGLYAELKSSKINTRRGYRVCQQEQITGSAGWAGIRLDAPKPTYFRPCRQGSLRH